MKIKLTACQLPRVTRLRKCYMLGNLLELSGAEQYFSRNLSKASVCLIDYRQHLLIFSLWDINRGAYHFSTIQTID